MCEKADKAQSAAVSFDPLRPLLTRVAYRMLGSMADAEDAVQDTFLRWMKAERDEINEPRAYLRKVVTRICLDQLKSARRQREFYVGPWLPEPVIEDDQGEIEDVTLPLMMALERLSPLERAAFILHDLFGVSFDEIAETLNRDAPACRQLASRARAHVRIDQPRYPASREKGLEIAEAFYNASRSGDMAALQAMLAKDVAQYADGGGKRPAVTSPILGAEAVGRLWASFVHIFDRHPSELVKVTVINGLPGFITREEDGLQTTAFEVVGGKIVGIYVMRNPDKLARMEQTLQ